MVRPGERREVARWAVSHRRVSARRACELCSISAGCYRYTPRRQPDDEIKEALTRLAESRPRWGFGLMFDWLRHVAGTQWGTQRYLDMRRLYDQENNVRMGGELSVAV